MHVNLGLLLSKGGAPKRGQRRSARPKMGAQQTARSLSKGLQPMKSIPVRGVTCTSVLHAGMAKQTSSPPQYNATAATCSGRSVVGIAFRGVAPTRSNQREDSSNGGGAMRMHHHYSANASGREKSQRGKPKVGPGNHVNNPAGYPASHLHKEQRRSCAPGRCAHWLAAVPLPDKVKENLRAYVTLSRLHIPTGIHLLLNSALYGYFLTLPVESLFTPGNEINWECITKIGRDLCLFAFGSLNSRIVGCIINDLFDRDYDRHVERTKNRPLANNTVTTARAFAYLALHSALSLLTLFQFSHQTISTGLLSTAFIISYPLMKRVTYYAQVYLSITFNLGFFISCSEHVELASNALALCVSFLPLCYLTVIYDTIYAHQDRWEDIQLKLKSLAIKWGDNTLVYSKLLAVNMTYLFYLSGYLFDLHCCYYVMATCNVLYLLHCIGETDLGDKEKCMRFFKKSKNVLMLFVLAAFVAKGCQAYQRWRQPPGEVLQDEKIPTGGETQQGTA
ncbi:para-hydroxybenzoate--polyprenyltransferase, putative [Plasmodium vivax]|nr:unnamed protein product [Plasmodium vivax]CAI7721557.1 4-hydroxybenzoate polyprenyltransferase, putative [Plasmodium vivax]SCO73781.1 para-hydroxybenzoate--polyprenyltransferase, putative [Plasmodium vivax]